MYTQIHNRKLHYKKIGSGEPIVFVHGWGGSIYSLYALAILASKKYTSYIVDLPGFGKSDNPPPHWGVEGYAEFLVFFIKHVVRSKINYVGHSFGGEIGIYITSHFPDIIDRLILCNSSYKRQTKISKIAQLLKFLPQNMILLRIFYPYVKKIYYTLINKQSDLIKYPHLEQNFRKIITQDLSDEVKKIQNKTLILWGELDTYTPSIWAYELEKNIQHNQLFMFPNIGHNLPIQYAERVWKKIQSFLEI